MDVCLNSLRPRSGLATGVVIAVTLLGGCTVNRNGADPTGGAGGTATVSATSGAAGGANTATNSASTQTVTSTSASTSAGVGGAGGTDPGVPEVCNGLDDDNDNVIDDGCPESVSIDNLALTVGTVMGAANGSFSQEFNTCPANEVVAAIEVHAGASFALRRVHVFCAPVTVVADKTVVPWSYSVERAALNMAPPAFTWGTVDEAVATAGCGPGAFVVGLGGYNWTNYGLGALDVQCARFDLVGNPTDGFDLVQQLEPVQRIGANGGSAVAIQTGAVDQAFLGGEAYLSDAGFGLRVRQITPAFATLEIAYIQP